MYRKLFIYKKYVPKEKDLKLPRMMEVDAAMADTQLMVVNN